MIYQYLMTAPLIHFATTGQTGSYIKMQSIPHLCSEAAGIYLLCPALRHIVPIKKGLPEASLLKEPHFRVAIISFCSRIVIQSQAEVNRFPQFPVKRGFLFYGSPRIVEIGYY